MKKLWLLSLANIRKTKGHTVSLLLMFFVSGLLLNIGLLVFLNFGSYFEKNVKELNASDMYCIMPSSLYTAKIDDYLYQNDSITKIQKENSCWITADFPYNGDMRKSTFLFNDMDNQRELSKWKFVGEHLPADENSIYLPCVMNIDGGYKLNDTIELSFNDTTLTFTIKGFTEDTFFSSFDTGMMGCYLPHDTFTAVSRKLGDENQTTLIFSNLKAINNDVQNGIRDILEQENTAGNTNSFYCIDISLIRLSRILMASLISIMTVVFAAIITAVCLSVVKFRIGNSIEEDMTKIGSLKSIGYTSRQIVWSIVLQFSMIAVTGCITGIAVSYATLPILSEVFAHQSGIRWEQGFDGMISFISLLIILAVVFAVSFFSSRRIHKLNPIVALRGGIQTHSFQKNYFPLDTSKGSLSMLFAWKSILQNKKQNLMMMVIFLAVSFASTFAFVMFYNTVINTDTFVQTPGVEISNTEAILEPNADNMALVENIRNMDGVQKAQFIDNVTLKVDNSSVITYVMDDYSQKKTKTVYEGRYPLHDNEIALSGHTAELLNKKIGDTVTVKVGSSQADYLITGLSQGSNMGGSTASILTEGIKKLEPDFKQQDLQIYLNKDINVDDFIAQINTLYGSSLLDVENIDREAQQEMGMYTSIISKVGVAIMVITIFIAMLVLYFVINSAVVRKKRDLGIQKSIGFTTFQLMNQLSLSFLPSFLTGIVLGSLLGITQTNNIMTIAQHSMGIMKANYIITTHLIALLGAILLLVSYLISLLITYRIRKISAYALVSE